MAAAGAGVGPGTGVGAGGAAEGMRLKDFVGSHWCRKGGVEFHLLQLFRPNTKNDGFHASCGNCGVVNRRRRSDLVSVKLKPRKPPPAQLADFPSQIPKSKQKRSGGRGGPAPPAHEELVDVVASLQRFQQARKALAWHGQLVAPLPSAAIDCAEGPEKKRVKAAVAPAPASSAVMRAALPLASSCADPVKRGVQPYRGDENVYSAWLAACGVDKAVVEFLVKHRNQNSAAAKPPQQSGAGGWDWTRHPDLFADVTTRDVGGDAGLERALLTMDHVKQYVPRMERGEMVWGEDFDLNLHCGGVDIARVIDPLRPVPSVLLQALRNHLEAAFDGDEIASFAARIPILPPSSTTADRKQPTTEHQTAALKRQGLERALGRQVEAMTDAAASMVKQCMHEQQEAANQADRDKALAIFDEEPDEDDDVNTATGVLCAVCGEALSPSLAAAPIAAAAAAAAGRHVCKIGWSGVLQAVRKRTRELEQQDKMSLRVHENLPALRLTPEVVSRFEARVLALFGGSDSSVCLPLTVVRVGAL